MGQGEKYVSETVGDIGRRASMIGSRGLYHLFLWVGGLLGLAVALQYAADGLENLIFVVFRVLYSCLGFTGSYQALTYKVGALAGLTLFLLPYAGIMAWTWFLRKGSERTRRRRMVWVSLALSLAAWSAQVPAQTMLSYSHPGARLRDRDRPDLKAETVQGKPVRSVTEPGNR